MPSMRRIPLLAAALLAGSLMPWSAGAQDATTDPPADTGLPSMAARVSAALDDTVVELHGDPEALRVWVRDAIATRAYDGVVQAELGAFLTRTGNDVDQALLLATMLERSGVQRRFATCEGTSIQDADVPATTAIGEEDLARTVADGLTDPELKSAALEVPGILAAAQAQTEAGAADLAALLEQEAVEPPTTQPQPALTSHTWVQAAAGASWLDLDTTTETGAPPCTASNTLTDIPEDWAHRLRIELEVETREAGEVASSIALETDLPLAEAALTPITFGFGAPASPGARLGAVLGGGPQFEPTLVVGDTTITGEAFTIPDAGGSGFGDFFGTSGDGATAAWLRFTLRAPDGTTRVLRSEVFDRIGVAAREADAAATAALLELEQVEDEYAALAGIWQAAVMTGPIRVADAATDTSPGADSAAPLDQVLRLYPSLLERVGGDAFGPIVLLAGALPTLDDDGAPSTRVVLDALDVPATPAPDRAAAARDAQAVVTAERALLRLLDLEPAPLGDAIGVFEAAAADSTPWLHLRPGDTPLIEGASDVAIARIARHLSDGAQILTPARAPERGSTRATAWWVIDPVTGLVRDQHESGRHGPFVEYSGQNARTVGWAERFRRASCRALGPLVVAAGIVFALGGATGDSAQLAKALAKTAQAAEENRRRGEQARKIACAGSGAASG